MTKKGRGYWHYCTHVEQLASSWQFRVHVPTTGEGTPLAQTVVLCNRRLATSTATATAVVNRSIYIRLCAGDVFPALLDPGFGKSFEPSAQGCLKVSKKPFF